MLWFSTSGRTSNRAAREVASPRASLISVSTVVCGRASRTAVTHAATWPIPPSGRSSRATIVSTAWRSPISAAAAATRAGSSAAGGAGRRVSTRQKPQARVHRSPSTMKVAVRSFQHSLRFGQPASSHTVTSPWPRTVCFRASTSRSCTTLGRSQSGLRVAMASPSLTPAWASRVAARWRVGTPWSPADRTTVPGPSPRENGARSSGRCFHATSWRSTVPSPQVAAARAATRSTTCSIGTSTPSSTSDVTGLSPMPHGTMCSRM